MMSTKFAKLLSVIVFATLLTVPVFAQGNQHLMQGSRWNTSTGAGKKPAFSSAPRGTSARQDPTKTADFLLASACTLPTSARSMTPSTQVRHLGHMRAIWTDRFT